jgi:hypothetical protein
MGPSSTKTHTHTQVQLLRKSGTVLHGVEKNMAVASRFIVTLILFIFLIERPNIIDMPERAGRSFLPSLHMQPFSSAINMETLAFQQ